MLLWDPEGVYVNSTVIWAVWAVDAGLNVEGELVVLVLVKVDVVGRGSAGSRGVGGVGGISVKVQRIHWRVRIRVLSVQPCFEPRIATGSLAFSGISIFCSNRQSPLPPLTPRFELTTNLNNTTQSRSSGSNHLLGLSSFNPPSAHVLPSEPTPHLTNFTILGLYPAHRVSSFSAPSPLPLPSSPDATMQNHLPCH